ncbi:hypothetical protein AMJ85_06620 [candidate division BRC1 bacterium SM23_51]|nr:MAG: hypothetical protein AMJ85_06620 [candidate division BRC1 bacterium SM23_51]
MTETQNKQAGNQRPRWHSPAIWHRELRHSPLWPTLLPHEKLVTFLIAVSVNLGKQPRENWQRPYQSYTMNIGEWVICQRHIAHEVFGIPANPKDLHTSEERRAARNAIHKVTRCLRKLRDYHWIETKRLGHQNDGVRIVLTVSAEVAHNLSRTTLKTATGKATIPVSRVFHAQPSPSGAQPCTQPKPDARVNEDSTKRPEAEPDHALRRAQPHMDTLLAEGRTKKLYTVGTSPRGHEMDISTEAISASDVHQAFQSWFQDSYGSEISCGGSLAVFQEIATYTNQQSWMRLDLSQHLKQFFANRPVSKAGPKDFLQHVRGGGAA